MSKLTDYSKFDHLDEDSDDEGNAGGVSQHQQPAVTSPVNPPNASPIATTTASTGPDTRQRKDETTGRYVFEYKGNEIYQWEQSLDDVTIYVKPPPIVTKGNQIMVEISANHLKLGLRGASTWFLNEPTFGKVDVSESTWSLEDEEGYDGKVITIYLTKAHRGQQWDAALQGNQAVQLDPLAKENVKKDLMLERFQEEHPGYDFRDADFNGSVPDPRTFMGGIKHN